MAWSFYPRSDGSILSERGKERNEKVNRRLSDVGARISAFRDGGSFFIPLGLPRPLPVTAEDEEVAAWMVECKKRESDKKLVQRLERKFIKTGDLVVFFHEERL